MDVQWWIDDEELLEVLRDAMSTAREMPAGLVAAGRAAYAWRTIDAELAALTYDSAWETEELALTRAESAELRTLTFSTEGLSIELELTPHEVLGQLSPPQPGTVRLSSDSDALGTLPIDDLGFFIVRPVPRHPFRVICETAAGFTVLTGWISP
ncbi:hypothetical protein [Kribbella sp. CA-293567]|uniref:hypothetical protein n=1 Tax=Kribbella sp. CA-293567 TaxID=3002436 RepID=UPI0022DE6442|nr:hypothetical protein [Kribbella sp. CA-293567]WBQ08233.1 hypothetical protein OX958_15830 [Kribbella sp. CA-293567]